jgi:hypothetical protein
MPCTTNLLGYIATHPADGAQVKFIIDNSFVSAVTFQSEVAKLRNLAVPFLARQVAKSPELVHDDKVFSVTSKRQLRYFAQVHVFTIGQARPCRRAARRSMQN